MHTWPGVTFAASQASVTKLHAVLAKADLPLLQNSRMPECSLLCVHITKGGGRVALPPGRSGGHKAEYITEGDLQGTQPRLPPECKVYSNAGKPANSNKYSRHVDKGTVGADRGAQPARNMLSFLGALISMPLRAAPACLRACALLAVVVCLHCAIQVATQFFTLQVVTVFFASFITGSLLNQLALLLTNPQQVLNILGTGERYRHTGWLDG